mgnify:FL=1
MKNRELGVYIHIPFCKCKCEYCDFISYCNKDNLIGDYIEAVKKEISLQNIQSYINTIYIGGGTPSYIDSKYIKEIIKEIKKKNVHKGAEVTIEVNPGTVTEAKLKDYKECGINRISIGLQTTQDELLKKIGRIHDYGQFLETYNLARKVGFKNINVDLMIGLPNQKIMDLKESLNRIIKLQPEHISVYSLIVEEGTPISKKIQSGELALPNENEERNMYWYVKNTLELNGYNHYEISNFSKKGYESRHNMSCWNQCQYFGFGVAAHSYRDITRYSNITDINEYIKNIQKGNLSKNRIIHEIQKESDTEKEYMLLGLRKIEGVKINDFNAKFVKNPIYLFRNELKKLSDENLIAVDANTIRLTPKGIDLANLVWEEFV